MAIVYDEAHLEGYVREAVRASPEHPVLVDSFLEDAYEVDVDALGDGERVVIAESWSTSKRRDPQRRLLPVLPPYKIAPRHLDTIRDMTRRLGLKLKVRGLMNVQFAIRGTRSTSSR